MTGRSVSAWAEDAGIDEVGPWLDAVTTFLGRSPSGPVTVTVEEGTDRSVPYTRGTSVVLFRRAARRDTLAPLAHELVHAVAGRSPVPAYNEGLAVHVDDRLRLAGPVWPFHHLPVDRWAASLRDEGRLPPVSALLAGGPSPDGGPAALWRFYLAAGSMVGFLRAALPDGELWDLYSGRRRLAPAEVVALEPAWRAGLGPPLGPDERAARRASLEDHRRWWLANGGHG